VSVYYTAEPQSDYLQDALIALVQLHLRLPPGDVLTFLTGAMGAWYGADCRQVARRSSG
jgi:HrpA-like RNA helicase